jgi:hypothetical protein
MLRASARYYLYCQTVGWGVLLLIFIASSRFFSHRIRSLIDEDATSARAEITAFSQLLRKGYLKVNDPQ